ncbi:hypothetical protein I3760_15G142400 [Carya illinoinensis]|nr:hypothetical protein I3760_15G142400 [Carya illinoinensis]
MIDKMMVWNVWGLGTSKRRLRNLIRKYKPSVLVLVNPFADKEVMVYWVNVFGYPLYCANEAMGGKIWVFWIDELTFEVHGMSDQMISGCLSKGADSINVVFVYARCNPVERRLLWQDMEAMSDDRTPLVVVGDFNIIREDRERIGGNPRSLSAMSEFNSCIHNCGLVEMTGYGGRMSWCKGIGVHRVVGQIWTLLNLAFSQRFPNGCMEYLKRKTSDHCPMLIKLAVESQRYGPTPFRFQSMWCTHENFLQCVEGVWREPVPRTGLVCLAAKLKKLKPVLRKWNQEIFGRVDQSIKELEAKVELLEMQLQERHVAELEHEYMQTKAELERWENREEIQLSQQAKKRWITEGDRNSKFYHAVVNQRRKASAVSRMTLPNGVVLESWEDIHNAAVIHFQNFLTGEGPTGVPDLSGLLSTVVNAEENQELVKDPTEEEVWAALKSIPKLSSPGPDGFGYEFYMHCWPIVK